jgi:hypothetical protein
MSFKAHSTQSDDMNELERKRALRSVNASPTESLGQKSGKVVRKERAENPDAPSVEQLAGAYYMQIADASDLSATWATVTEALVSLPSTDFAPVEGENVAHSVQYHQDGFSVARSRLCQLDNKGDTDYFVEVSKLSGNGFIFQDQFVAALQGALQEGFKAVEQLEQPAPLEEAETSNLAFLDLSDQDIAYPMIEKWLTSLQPKKGVQWDQMVLFESLSTLAWNLSAPENFKVLADYSNDIVARVLNILKAEETTSVPTGYFAAKILEKFFSEASAVPDTLKVWDTVLSLEKSLMKWSTPNLKAVHKEVTVSRGVFTTLLAVLRNAGNMMAGEPDAAVLKKSEAFVNGVEARMASISASWPADCTLEDLCKALRVPAPAREEEVQSA